MNTLKDRGHNKVFHKVFQVLNLLLGGVSLSVEVQKKMNSTIAASPATNFSIEPVFDNFNHWNQDPQRGKRKSRGAIVVFFSK